MSKTRYYTPSHEWLDVDGNEITIGITDHAQSQLGDIVFVQLPALEQRLARDEEAVVIESVKAAGDICSPLAGEVVAINEALVDAPETVNEDPEGEAWFFRLRTGDPVDVADLMNAADYQAYIGG